MYQEKHKVVALSIDWRWNGKWRLFCRYNETWVMLRDVYKLPTSIKNHGITWKFAYPVTPTTQVFLSSKSSDKCQDILL